jgi:4-amino-4-deoxy-L-arabinose transferase-like glycosyltransferase
LSQKEVYARRERNKMRPVNEAPEQPANRWFPYRFQILAGAILLIMAANLISVTARKSITADEIVLIPAAYYYLVDDKVNLIGQHPPLCKFLAGLPLLFVQPNEWKAEKVDPAGRPDQNEWGFVQRFWADNRAQFELICFWSRLPMIALTLALGLLIFIFARDLLGPRAAVLAVALFALEPTILAHGKIVQTDIPAAFGLLLSVYAFWKYIRAPSWKTACGLGAAVAVALLAKYSMLLVVPAVFAAPLALCFTPDTRRMDRFRDAIFAAATFLVVVNAAYFFNHRDLTPGDLKWISDVFPESQTILTTGVRISRWLLPTDLVMGIYWQLHHARVGHPAGLLGMYTNHGWWYYFPVAFFFKTTIPFLLLSLLSFTWAIRRMVIRREGKWLALLVPLTLYTGLMVTSPIDIGVRYYLPAYSFFIILSAGFLDLLLQRRSSPFRRYAATVGVSVALLWIAFEAAWTYPHYIPYMNQLAFSRPHWWYLSDSNVEWGEDSKALATWLQARGESRVRGLLLGCFATLDFYRINYVDALSQITGPHPRYTALGASFLNGSTVPPYDVGGRRVSDETRVNTFESYRNRKPEGIIGNSIYIYRDGN